MGFGVGVELDVEVEAVGVAAELEGLREELAGPDGCHEQGELCSLRGGDGEGLGVLREGVEAEGGFGDDGEGAKGAGEEFAEVVAGDVFDDATAGPGDGAVGEDKGHADDQVAKAAVTMPECAGVVRGEDAADGGAIGPEGVEGDELTVLRECLLELLPGAAGLDGAGEVLPGVFDDSVEAGEIEVDSCFGGISPGLLCAASDWGYGEGVLVGVAEDFRDLLGIGGRDFDRVFVRAYVSGACDGGESFGNVGCGGHSMFIAAR